MLRSTEPERPADAAREAQLAGNTLVEPRCRHRAAQRSSTRGERSESTSAKIASESTVISGVARAEAELGEDRIVVRDESVVDADHGAVPDRVVVRLDGRVALRVVADVDERLRRAAGDLHAVEEPGRAAVLLVDVDVGPAVPPCVPDRVGAALGDPGEERLRRERALDAALAAEAISRNAAHMNAA